MRSLPALDGALYESVCAPAASTFPAWDDASSLLAHPWPGNLRELLNVIQRAAMMIRRPVITAADLKFLAAAAMERMGGNAPRRHVEDNADKAAGRHMPGRLNGTLPELVARTEIALIRHALTVAAGNRAQAAERLGMRRQLLYQKLARYGLEVSPNGTDSVSEADSSPAMDPPPL